MKNIIAISLVLLAMSCTKEKKICWTCQINNTFYSTDSAGLVNIKLCPVKNKDGFVPFCNMTQSDINGIKSTMFAKYIVNDSGRYVTVNPNPNCLPD